MPKVSMVLIFTCNICSSGPCPKVHSLNIADSKLHTLRYGKEQIANLESVKCFL